MNWCPCLAATLWMASGRTARRRQWCATAAPAVVDHRPTTPYKAWDRWLTRLTMLISTGKDARAPHKAGGRQRAGQAEACSGGLGRWLHCQICTDACS